MNACLSFNFWPTLYVLSGLQRCAQMFDRNNAI